MKIAVIGAMRKEIEFLLPRLENLREEKSLKHLFYRGSLSGKEIIVVQSGIGKVAAGILFSALVHTYPGLDLVINTGVAGGVSGRVEIGDVVVAEKAAHADVDVTSAGLYDYGQIPDCPLFFLTASEFVLKADVPHPYKVGTILSGDRFFSEKEDIEHLITGHFRNENVLAFDMESAAFAQSAWFYGIPFISVRAISDLIGRKGQFEEYLENVESASQKSNQILLSAIASFK